jgi:GNAT superfamily N-acetyltransferase
MDPDIHIVSGYQPGAIGRITELHADYYHARWGFGLYFEAKVATELSEFLSRFDQNTDGIWLVKDGKRIEGSIVIDACQASDKGAHLRWFIVSDALKEQGLGRQLINRAVRFCRSRMYRKIYLWTFEGLHAARHLYEDFGFRLVKQHRGNQWGVKVTEQRFERFVD